MSVTNVAEGPAMFLGSSVMSFALPLGAFIVIATALFLLFRARHALPRLKYLPAGTATSVMTREPAPLPLSAPAREDAGEGEVPAPAGEPG